MSSVLTWILVAATIGIVSVMLATLPAWRTTPPEETLPVPVPTTLSPTPKPEALTPEKVQLADLQAESDTLVLGDDLDADLAGLDQELRGL